MEDLQIFELKRMDIRGAVVIEGFPSVGLVSSIAANYLISILELEQIGILDSSSFPTVSVIKDGEPLNPVRIYASERIEIGDDTNQIVVFVSEFQPSTKIIKPIANSVMDWVQDQGCKMVISPEGLIIEHEETAEIPDGASMRGDGKAEKLSGVIGIGSNRSARELLEENGIDIFQEGVVSGVAGVLLNEGKRRNFDVISILAEARPDYPDARAAAMVIEAIAKLLPYLKIDVGPLYKEAESIENQIKGLSEEVSRAPQQTAKGGVDESGMFG